MTHVYRRVRAIVARIALVATLVSSTGLAAAATAPVTLGLDNGLALTPPMGFNDWNSFGCNIDTQDFRDTADLFVSSGLKDAGYEYINIDDCWMAGRDIPRGNPARATAGRDPVTHQLIPDPAYFPDVDENGNGVIDPSEERNGIKALADYIHSLGLKIGIYSSAGTTTCQGLAGSLGYEEIDAQTWADWGIDYLKYDTCGGQTDPITGVTYPNTVDGHIARYAKMGDALLATGRAIVYSLCDFTTQGQHWTWGADVGNLWRTTGDIRDTYASLVSLFKQNVILADYSSIGAWNDPDMLQIGNGGMTDVEYRSHLSLWAMMAAPLLIGTDLREATPETWAILLNTDVIAIDQDSLGIQAEVVSQSGSAWVLAKPLAGGDVAVALFNEGASATTITTSVADIGVTAKRNAYTLQDLWSKETSHTTGSISAVVPPHGTVIYRVSSRAGATSAAPSVSLDVTSAGDTLIPGEQTTIDVAVENNGRNAVDSVAIDLVGPAGWTVSHVSGPAKTTLPGGGVAIATYQVTAPSSPDSPIATAAFDVTASYHSDAGGTQALSSSLDLTVASPVGSPYETANTTGSPAVFGQTGSTVAISASGAGVAQATGGPFGGPAADQYGAIYVPGGLVNNGTVEVVVVDQGSTGSKSGIMVRTDMDAGGTPVGVAFAVSGSRAEIVYNNSVGGGTAYTTRLRPNIGNFANPVHLRLVRSGATYAGYISTDGSTWTAVGSITANGQPSTLDVGVFHTSGVAGNPTIGLFSDLTVQ